MGNKILVTGATGFVGSELCAQLAVAGNSIVGVGRSVMKAGLSGVTYRRLDLEVDDLDVELLRGVDCIVHLAGQAHGKGGGDRQELDGFRRTNVDVSLRLAKQAVAAGVRRFLFVSSIGVHGTVTHGAAISETSPFKPGSPYTVSKMEAELELIKLFDEVGSPELTIVRPPLVYGAKAPGNFKSLLKLANLSVPLPFGLCNNRRSLISLAALVDFLIVCTRHPGAGNQSFVVADSSVVSTREIVASLRSGMNRAARLVPVPPAVIAGALGLVGKREMYNQLFRNLEIDNQKAKTLVNWMPCENTARELVIIGKFYANSCI